MGDEERVVIHLDVDSFYCQCERLRRPDIDRQPLAITQRNRGGFVAVSYEAKACGVRKGDGIGRGGLLHLEAFRGRPEAALDQVLLRCPALRILPMDMPYYRRCSASLAAELRRLFTIVQRSSIDDFLCDVTNEARWLVAAAARRDYASGAEHLRPGLAGPGGALLAHPAICRWMEGTEEHECTVSTYVATASHDIAQVGPHGVVESDAADAAALGCEHALARKGPGQCDSWTPGSVRLCGREAAGLRGATAPRLPRVLPAHLRAGCALAALARAHVRHASRGLTMSAGIAPNPLLARQVSMRNRPDRQTVLCPAAAEAFTAALPILRVPGFRHQAGRSLCARLGVTTLSDLRRCPAAAIVGAVPAQHAQRAKWLVAAAWGRDATPVEPEGAPSLVGSIAEQTTTLSAELIARLQDHYSLHGAVPRRILVRWRPGFEAKPTSRAFPSPPEVATAARLGAPASRILAGEAFFARVAAGAQGGGAARPLPATSSGAAFERGEDAHTLWRDEGGIGSRGRNQAARAEEQAAERSLLACVRRALARSGERRHLTKLGLTATSFESERRGPAGERRCTSSPAASALRGWLDPSCYRRGRSDLPPHERGGDDANVAGYGPHRSRASRRVRDRRHGGTGCHLPPTAVTECGSPDESLLSDYSMSPDSRR